MLETLENIRGKLIYMHIGAIQRVFRGTRQRKIFVRTRKLCIKIQAQMRRVFYKQRFRKFVKALRSLQRFVRVFTAKRRVQKLRLVTRRLTLQCWARMIPKRRAFIRIRRAAKFLGRFAAFFSLLLQL